MMVFVSEFLTLLDSVAMLCFCMVFLVDVMPDQEAMISIFKMLVNLTSVRIGIIDSCSPLAFAVTG